MVLPSYAAYVWSAYGISAAVLSVTAAMAYAKWRSARKRLAELKDSETNI